MIIVSAFPHEAEQRL